MKYIFPLKPNPYIIKFICVTKLLIVGIIKAGTIEARICSGRIPIFSNLIPSCKTIESTFFGSDCGSFISFIPIVIPHSFHEKRNRRTKNPTVRQFPYIQPAFPPDYFILFISFIPSARGISRGPCLYIMASTISITALPSASDLASASSREVPLMP